MGRSVVDGVEEASLGETQLKGTELAGQEGNDVGNLRRWDEDTVNAMDDPIGTKLEGSRKYKAAKFGQDKLTMSTAMMRL